MNTSSLNVLVVEDDVAVRRLTARALIEEGLHCDTAVDGIEALQMLAQKRYGLVVTDILMPRHHGHALAVEILGREHAPMVVILTGVAEPRITKDLIAHGVDDVVFKPVDYRNFAAKLKACLERHALVSGLATGAASGTRQRTEGRRGSQSASVEVPLDELERALDGDLQVPPISPAAFDVYRAAQSGTADPHALADLLDRDPSLARQVLRLANSEAFNRSGKPVEKLERAIALVGHTRVGEVALAASAMNMLQACKQSPLNTGAAWERSVAAALIARNFEREGSEGLFLSALLHLMGRIVLAGLFPAEYGQLLSSCQRSKQTLADLERRAFPLSHAEVVTRLAERWGFPAELTDPLRRAIDQPAGRCPLGLAWDPTSDGTDCDAARVIQFSAALAPICTQRWEPWDVVELPSPALAKPLSHKPLSHLIAQTRQHLASVKQTMKLPATEAPLAEPAKKIAYLSLVPAGADCFPEVLEAMGIRPVPADGVGDRGGTMIVNAFGVEPANLGRLCGLNGPPERRIILTDAANIDCTRECGAALRLPCGFAMLQSVCSHAAASTDNWGSSSG